MLSARGHGRGCLRKSYGILHLGEGWALRFVDFVLRNSASIVSISYTRSFSRWICHIASCLKTLRQSIRPQYWIANKIAFNKDKFPLWLMYLQHDHQSMMCASGSYLWSFLCQTAMSEDKWFKKMCNGGSVHGFWWRSYRRRVLWAEHLIKNFYYQIQKMTMKNTNNKQNTNENSQ